VHGKKAGGPRSTTARGALKTARRGGRIRWVKAAIKNHGSLACLRKKSERHIGRTSATVTFRMTTDLEKVKRANIKKKVVIPGGGLLEKSPQRKRHERIEEGGLEC